MKKVRLDQLIFDMGFVPSRERAKTTIMAGNVFVDGQRVDKPGTAVDPEKKIEVRGEALPYVSRGGLKLEKALQVFPVDMQGKTVLDIGSSTGGFVDCALQNGAAEVISVDVGYGQLAWKLRTDERVAVWEKTNARYLTEEQVSKPVDIVTVDASFISLAKVIACPLTFLKEQGELIALIKPQFEAGKEKIGKKGVVREKSTHIEVIEKVLGEISSLGMSIKALDFSPITGPEGNIEYLLYAVKEDTGAAVFDIPALVDASWQSHGK